MYRAKIEFSYFEELGNNDRDTALSIPNGACFTFWDCRLKYVNNSEFNHYFEIFANKEEYITECLSILSFFTYIPLLPLSSSEMIIEDMCEGEKIPAEKQSDKMNDWLERLALIEMGLKEKIHDEKRKKIINWMETYSYGIKHHYQENGKEEFLNLFIPVEKISATVLQEYETEEKEPANTNREKIILAWKRLKSYYLGGYQFENEKTKKSFSEINDKKIGNLVKIRNKIAHDGYRVTEEDIRTIQFLSSQFISIYALKKPYNEYYLRSRVLGEKF